jgi:hypothetical protein
MARMEGFFRRIVNDSRRDWSCIDLQYEPSHISIISVGPGPPDAIWLGKLPHLVTRFLRHHAVLNGSSNQELWNHQSNDHPFDFGTAPLESFDQSVFQLVTIGSLPGDIEMLNSPGADQQGKERTPQNVQSATHVCRGHEVYDMRWKRTIWGEGSRRRC